MTSLVQKPWVSLLVLARLKKMLKLRSYHLSVPVSSSSVLPGTGSDTCVGKFYQLILELPPHILTRPDPFRRPMEEGPEVGLLLHGLRGPI